MPDGESAPESLPLADYAPFRETEVHEMTQVEDPASSEPEMNVSPVLSPKLNLKFTISKSSESNIRSSRALSRNSVERLTSKAMVRVRSTKPLTIPVTPVSRLMQRLGEKKYSTMGPESKERVQVVAHGNQSTGQVLGEAIATGKPPLTIPVSPKLITKTRAMSTCRTRPSNNAQQVPSDLVSARSLSTVRRDSRPRLTLFDTASVPVNTNATAVNRRSSRGAPRHHDKQNAVEVPVPQPAIRTEYIPTVPVSPKISKPRAVSAPPKRF